MSHISGDEEVTFLKEDLSGTAGKVEWLFTEDNMILKEEPRIMKKKGGATMGAELKINLKTNEITILSSGTERSETIIRWYI